MIDAQRALQLILPIPLAQISLAQLELGNLAAGYAAAAQSVNFIRESKSVWNPRCYAMLVRSQLALGKPGAEIAATLEEYDAVLNRTEFHLYKGELYELRADLAAREGFDTVRIAA